MEWVETTGRSVEEALDAALDELGVDAADAEYEVMEEPRTGLFGRVRTEARIRARVRRTAPRPKDDRRNRAKKASAGTATGATAASPQVEPVVDQKAAPLGVGSAPAEARVPRRPAQTSSRAHQRGSDVSETGVAVPLPEQAEAASSFLSGLLERFGAVGAGVAIELVDDETVELRVSGENLGQLIGPKGLTLQSLQEITRTVVQRQTGARSGRILVDVNGYQQRRRDALARWARQIANDVLESGTPVVLEPMTPADRKVIHDTVNEIDGVETTSEGEEPRRRVVVSPASS